MPKITSTIKVSSYTLPTIPLGRLVNLKTGESIAYGQQQMPEALFEAVLADAAQFLGFTLRKGVR